MTGALEARAREVFAGAVSIVRRGPRTILFTPQIHMGVGNFLYLWLWADARQARGLPDLVLRNPTMDTWLRDFPTMQSLVVSRDAVRFRDLRALGYFQRFGEAYSADELAAFIRRRVLPVPGLAGITPKAVDPRRVVVNVRRGDYYSNPTFRARFGFNITSYLRAAFEQAEWGDISGIHVVSDGLDWCRDNLGWLRDIAPLTFAAEGEGPMANLREVASSRRVVLTNSTFSYWAGYIGGVVHGDNHRDVLVPWFHDRKVNGGAAYQLDPRWSVVESIDGGWDE